MGASKVILTDLQEALALLRRNASTSNFAAAVDIRSLKWGEPFDYEAFDLVLACDCIYQPECYEAFAATITALDAPALIAWRPRGRREEEALRLIAASGFSIVDESRQPVDPEVRIIWATPPRLVMPCGLPLSVSCAGLVTSDPHMLQPDIIEAVGEAVSTAADELVALEQHTAGHTDASWMAQASIQSWHQEASPFSVQLAETFTPNMAAGRIAAPLRGFCACMLDALEPYLRPKLNRLLLALEAASLASLELHLAVTFTLSRKAVDDVYQNEIVHADAFDGTVLGLVFLCNKMGTRIYPQAVFREPPIDQFVQESHSGRRNGYSLVSSTGIEMRTLRPRTMLIMPAAVAHVRPDGAVGSFMPAGPRWFARAMIELKPKGGPKAWGDKRAAVAQLVAEHVWGDPAFAQAARDQTIVGV